MTKEEAAQLLNVSVNAPQSEIQSKFQEMFNEYQIRLTNAPTPNLKKIYQNNLQELNTALSVLSGKSAAAVSDLPSSSPTYKQVEHQQAAAPPTPASEVKAATPHTNTPGKEKAKEKKGVPSSTITAIGVALVAIAGIVFLVIKTFEDKAAIAKLQLSADSVTTVLTQLSDYKTKFDNQKFKIKNDGTTDLTVKLLFVTYRNEFNKLERKAYLPNQLIRKGSASDFKLVEGSRVVWDGSVISYTLVIDKPGTEDYINEANIYSLAMSEDKILHLDLDNY